MHNRLYWADILRSFAILSVVIIHNFNITNHNQLDILLNILIFSVIKTSVPIFIMLSGALLLQKKETWFIFYNKRVKKVVIPWILWTIIFIILNKFLNIRNFDTFSEFKDVTFTTLFTELWFIPIIAGIYAITPLWKSLANKKNKKLLQYIILLWFIFCSFLPFIHESITFPLYPNGYFTQILYYSMYYLLGYSIITHNILIKKRKYLVIIGILCIVINYIDYALYSNAEHTFSYFSPTILLLSYIIFCFIYNNKNKKLESVSTNNFIISISKKSLSIFIIHHLLMTLLNTVIHPYTLYLNTYSGGASGIIIGSVYFLLSYLLISFIQKIPKTKYIFP